MNTSVSLLGVRVDTIAAKPLLERIALACQRKEQLLILHANVHGLNLAYTNQRMRTILNQADITFCDGHGVKLAARLFGTHIEKRITYADWTWELAETANRHGLSLFLLGSRVGVAEQAAAKLRERYPQLIIAGTHHGYFDKQQDSAENNHVINLIEQAQPDILLTCFGMPYQEYWLSENRHRLKAAVLLSGGAALDYISGGLARGPDWLVHNGFEWLARLFIEPRRLWRRYVLGNPLFILRILRQRFGPQDRNELT